MEDIHRRKQLRLQGYDYAQAGAYFITVCTKDRMPILGEIVGADDHIGPYTNLSAIGKIVDQYTCSIQGVDQYVIMPDHVHMILRVTSAEVSEGPVWDSALMKKSVDSTVRSWKTLITKTVGQSIWQRSYFDHIIRCEQDYYEIVKYIEQNPLKWYVQHHKL